jgi:hypothetical protein
VNNTNQIKYDDHYYDKYNDFKYEEPELFKMIKELREKKSAPSEFELIVEEFKKNGLNDLAHSFYESKMGGFTGNESSARGRYFLKNLNKEDIPKSLYNRLKIYISNGK